MHDLPLPAPRGTGARRASSPVLALLLLAAACGGPSRRAAEPPPASPGPAAAARPAPRATPAAAPPAAAPSADPGTDLAAAQVRKVIDALARADSAEDLDAVLALWHDDALWIGPDGRSVAGKPALRDEYAALFERFDLTVEIAVEEIELDANGKLARVHGTTRVQRVPRAGGETEEARDRYIMGLLREGDGWRILRLVWQPVGHGLLRP